MNQERREEAHHAWTELRGSGMCRQRLHGVLEARERGLRTQSPRKTGWQHRVGRWLEAERPTRSQSIRRGAQHNSESWGLRSGPEENGARELCGLREGDPLAVRGKSESSEQRAEDPIQGQGFRVRLWRGDGRMPLELPGQTVTPILSRRPTAPPHAAPAPPALLFVSQSGRNRLLLAAGRAGGCRLVNACFQPRLSQSACGSVFY